MAGGAAAQCLGLMNAIYASNKLHIPFKISYYPYSTGTYWPFALNFLLNPSEVLDSSVPTKGLKHSDNLQIGRIINTHPLFKDTYSYEKWLSTLRRFKLEPLLQVSRRELAIRSSPSRLMKINQFFKSVSGGFAQINDPAVNREMNLRFEKSNMQSPFTNNTLNKNLTVIHYRLGDKRATPAQMKHTKDFNTDLIIDPESYAQVLMQIKDLEIESVYVVSDEPNTAKKLLSSAGINAKTYSSAGNIWDDVYFMSQAKNFIGTKSQVSQLVNICVENNHGNSYMLNFLPKNASLRFTRTKYLKTKFLEPDNEIYSLDFSLETN